MKIVMADAILTEFDWVGFVGAFVLAQILVWYVPPVLVLAISWSAFLLWHRHWKKRRDARLPE